MRMQILGHCYGQWNYKLSVRLKLEVSRRIFECCSIRSGVTDVYQTFEENIVRLFEMETVYQRLPYRVNAKSRVVVVWKLETKTIHEKMFFSLYLMKWVWFRFAWNVTVLTCVRMILGMCVIISSPPRTCHSQQTNLYIKFNNFEREHTSRAEHNK